MRAKGRTSVSIGLTWSTVASVVVALTSAGVGAAWAVAVRGVSEVSDIESSSNSTIANLTAPGVSFDGGIFDPSTQNLYLTFQGGAGGCTSGRVMEISGASLAPLANFTTQADPTGPALDPTSGDLYLGSNSFCDNVTVLDPTSGAILATDGVSGAPLAPVWDAATGAAYFPTVSTNLANGSVVGVSGLATIAPIPIPFVPGSVTLDPDSGTLYVSGLLTPTVEVVSRGQSSAVASIGLGGSAALGRLTFDPANGDLYTAQGDNVSVISTTTNESIAQVPVGADPASPVYDPTNSLLYVANLRSGTVSVISSSSNSVVATISDVPSPGAPLYDSQNGDLYIPTDFDGSYASSPLCVYSPSEQRILGYTPAGLGQSTPLLDPTTGDLLIPDYADAGNLAVVTVVSPIPAVTGDTCSPTGATTTAAVVGPTTLAVGVGVALGLAGLAVWVRIRGRDPDRS